MLKTDKTLILMYFFGVQNKVGETLGYELCNNFDILLALSVKTHYHLRKINVLLFERRKNQYENI